MVRPAYHAVTSAACPERGPGSKSGRLGTRGAIEEGLQFSDSAPHFYPAFATTRRAADTELGNRG